MALLFRLLIIMMVTSACLALRQPRQAAPPETVIDIDTPATGASFTIATGVFNLSVEQGGSGGVTVAIARAADAAALDITLTLLDPPAGVSGGGLIGANQASASLVLAVAATVPVGTYAITVAAEDVHTRQDLSLTLTVTPARTTGVGLGASMVSHSQDGGVDDVIVTIARANHALPVTLSAEGVPNGTTATFLPGPLVSDATVTLRLTTSLGGFFGTTTVTVRAVTAGLADATADLTLTITPARAITATVIDLDGYVVPNAHVVIDGQLRTTDASGVASAVIARAPTDPYDIFFASSLGAVSSTSRAVVRYVGLTRADPTLVAPQDDLGLAGAVASSSLSFGFLTSGGAYYDVGSAIAAKWSWLRLTGRRIQNGRDYYLAPVSFVADAGTWPGQVLHPFGADTSTPRVLTLNALASPATYSARIGAILVDLADRAGAQPDCGTDTCVSSPFGLTVLGYRFASVCTIAGITGGSNAVVSMSSPTHCTETPFTDGFPTTALASANRTLNVTAPGAFTVNPIELWINNLQLHRAEAVVFDCPNGFGASCAPGALPSSATYRVPTGSSTWEGVIRLRLVNGLRRIVVAASVSQGDVSVTVPDTATAVAPADMASAAVTGSTFSWTTPAPDKTHILHLQSLGGSAVAYLCVTNATSCSVPAGLASFGPDFALPAPASYLWTVESDLVASSVDAFAAATPGRFAMRIPVDSLVERAFPPSATQTMFISASRAFTAQ